MVFNMSPCKIWVHAFSVFNNWPFWLIIFNNMSLEHISIRRLDLKPMDDSLYTSIQKFWPSFENTVKTNIWSDVLYFKMSTKVPLDIALWKFKGVRIWLSLLPKTVLCECNYVLCKDCILLLGEWIYEQASSGFTKRVSAMWHITFFSGASQQCSWHLAAFSLMS